MREPDIKALFKDVVGPNTKFERLGEWVMLPCPLARWTHPRGSDRNPSFGVHIENQGTSMFNCFTCKKKGPLSRFLDLYGGFTGKDFDDLIDSIRKEEIYQAELPDWDSCRQLQNEEPLEPLHPHFEDFYDEITEIPDYLKDRMWLKGQPKKERMRQIKKAIKLTKLAIDPDDNGNERIVFPVYGLDKNLYGFTGRATDDDVQPKVKDYLGLRKEMLLLGLHLIDKDTKYILLVEGLIDYLNAVSYGYTALAQLGSNLTDAQAAVLREIGLPIYLFYDNDEPGYAGAEIARAKLKDFVPVMRTHYSDATAEDDLDDDGPEDPGMMYDWEFAAMIEKARLQ